MEEVRNKMENILDSIKKLLGIPPEYMIFDADLIMHINTVFVILNQLNIGPPECFFLKDGSECWDEFITSVDEAMVRTFVYLKVRLMFDPPASSALIESMNAMLAELEWRLYISGDSKAKGGDEGE